MNTIDLTTLTDDERQEYEDGRGKCIAEIASRIGSRDVAVAVYECIAPFPPPSFSHRLEMAIDFRPGPGEFRAPAVLTIAPDGLHYWRLGFGTAQCPRPDLGETLEWLDYVSGIVAKARIVDAMLCTAARNRMKIEACVPSDPDPSKPALALGLHPGSSSDRTTGLRHGLAAHHARV